MNEAISKGLEGALRTVVASNGTGEQVGNGAPNDLLSLVMKVLPTLLENTEEREGLVDLLKENDSALKEELRLLRKEQRLMRREQRKLYEELGLMRELQLVMVDHLARVQILDVPEDDEFADEYSDDIDDAEGFPEAEHNKPSMRRRSGTLSGSKSRGPRKSRKSHR